ncbi:TnsD family Tn7-like transposition protein [Lysinibacillus irui]|uniref:TnsD family Tn7-like transposition protein n=1 Tax=Lysinibacillus irui TaxID=2998077 RepID=A0AAJ5RKL1_9BACI|nr:TnsD family Tn7-like transposition protein [Lysinibacillus irui]WDV06735.1 TnsD family Tn7-like transposition protein [Lysinibacillus irui]
MLPFFTNPYPNELIYSAIARYHFYSGNIDCKDTLEELFDNRSVIPSVGIGSYFSVLAEKLGAQYSVESLLANHTIYPYYASFLSKQRQQEILNDVREDGKALYTRLGMVAGSICIKNGIYYCAICAKSDTEQYGEPYIHREHQLQGIDYCPHHEVLLREYSVTKDSRIEYIRFELNHMNLSELYEIDPHKEMSVYLAKQAYKLLHLPLHSISRENINSKYKALLREYNLITASNQVRQYGLYQAIKNIFPYNFLQCYDSELNEKDEYNWLKILTRNMKRHVHPFRHLLLLYFLQQDVDSLINQSDDTGAFGKGPFPCLNMAASHYKQLVIPNVEVTRDYKLESLIGTFTCSCGFIYARKHTKDMFEIGRVKVFGKVWIKKLEALAKEKWSIRAMAKILGVDSKTIKRYLNGNVELIQVESHEYDVNKLGQYKQELLKEIQQNPNLSRTALRKKIAKQYMYLYHYDRSYLESVLPKVQLRNKPTRSVDWSKRDQQYVQQIKRLHQQLLQELKPIRITKSILGRRLGISGNLEHHLDKLPSTNELLNDITETVQDFQIRRCYKVIDALIKQNSIIDLWRIQRIAAIKSHHFHEIKPQLKHYIEMKQEVSK